MRVVCVYTYDTHTHSYTKSQLIEPKIDVQAGFWVDLKLPNMTTVDFGQILYLIAIGIINIY